MNYAFFKNHWQLILFNILILLCFIIGYGHFGDIIVDSFREAYIPEQVLNGQVLYKNIFTIYAPFSYLFNAVLFKIFGINLRVLYFAGLIASIGILNLVYFISNKFMAKTYSLSIVLFIISASVLSPNVFNFFFPYSYGVLYGLLFILGAIYCGLNKKFFLAYLFYSFAVCNKYEFILFLPILIYISERKDILKNLAGLIIPPILTFTPLFIQGLKIEDLLTSVQILFAMSSTKTLYWFYSIMGLVFRWELIPIYIMNFLKVFIPLMFTYYFRSWWLAVILLIYFYFIVTPEILIYAFPLILVLFALNFRTLNKNKRFLIAGSLLVSMKLFFALTLKSYGVFFLPFALIPIFILIPKIFKKALLIITLICSFVLGIQNTISLANKNVCVKTEKGVVYTGKNYGESINELINYIKENSSKDEKVLVYPECLAINFLADRQSDNKFYSLIPLYVETFGEDLITGRFEVTKPDYIVINNYDTSNYYYSYFGQDYAGGIFNYMLNNYENKARLGNELVFIVYRRK